MFDSGISVSELIADLKEEVDIAIPIPDKLYITWLNSLEQLLYSEYIKEQRYNGFIRQVAIQEPSEETGELIDIYESLGDIKFTPDSDEEEMRFEDIYAVYFNDIQLLKVNQASGSFIPNSYYKDDTKYSQCGANVDNTESGEFKVYYHPRPKLKTGAEGENVMLPLEFIDLVKAKLRGEAYKIANEDVLAAKWLNDYNILLETFKVWLADKAATVGI